MINNAIIIKIMAKIKILKEISKIQISCAEQPKILIIFPRIKSNQWIEKYVSNFRKANKFTQLSWRYFNE